MSLLFSLFFCSIFECTESDVADEQLEKLEQIAALPMSSVESKTIKPLIVTMDNLLREWISADKDEKGETYALMKMLVPLFLFIRRSLMPKHVLTANEFRHFIRVKFLLLFVGRTRCTAK